MLEKRRLLRLAIPLLAAIVVVVAYRGRLSGDFRTDEPHKIAETYYLRLLERGDFAHRDWFLDAVERSNPVAGKYIFGLAIQLAGGELPHDLAAAQATNDGQRQPPAAVESQFRTNLGPVRIVSLIATAITAALVALVAYHASGIFGSIISALFFVTNFLTQAFAGTAVFDPLLMLFVTATLVTIDAISLSDDRIKRDLLLSAAAGVLGGVAYQIRLTGAFAVIVFCGAILLRSAVAKRFRRGLAMCVVAGAVAVIVGTAMNPFYWSSPSDQAIAPQFREGRAMPIRIVDRYEAQLSDLRAILAREEGRQKVLRTIPEKSNYVFQYACGDYAGLAMIAGLLLALFFFRDLQPAARVALGWTLALVIVFTAWIPIGYPRFVLLAVPPLAIAGGVGWATVITGTVSLIRERSKK